MTFCRSPRRLPFLPLLGCCLILPLLIAQTGCLGPRGAAGSLRPTPDGRYLLEQTSGRIVLWAHRGDYWRVSWRQLAPIGHTALPVYDGNRVIGILAAGDKLAAYDGGGRRWQARAPAKMVFREILAADLDGDGGEELIASYGRTLAGAALGLLVFGRDGRRLAAWSEAGWRLGAVFHGDLDGNGIDELLIGADKTAAAAKRVMLIPLTLEAHGLKPFAAPSQAPPHRELAMADLDHDGCADLLALTGQGEGFTMQLQRWTGRGFQGVGPKLSLPRGGELASLGRGLATLERATGQGRYYQLLVWQEEHLAVRTEFGPLGPGRYLIPYESDRAAMVELKGGRGRLVQLD